MIFGFEKLNVWQNAIALTVKIYRLTKGFPQSELYSLTDQLRRASSSVPANITEGNARNTEKDKIHFINISYSSLMETLNHLILAQRLGYIEDSILNDLRKDIEEIANQLIALRKYHQSKNT